MTTPAAIVLRLEIDGTAEPISGRLSAATGLVVAFTGWVGLAAAIEQAMRVGDGLDKSGQR